jgi:metal-responsive CopG/Arc/MetJ family transcriptional regulator
MDKTLTIRLDRAQDEALTARARALGKTRSELVRELIEQGLEERPLGRRIGHLKGRLDVPSPRTGWQKRIKERNWR